MNKILRYSSGGFLRTDRLVPMYRVEGWCLGKDWCFQRRLDLAHDQGVNIFLG